MNKMKSNFHIHPGRLAKLALAASCVQDDQIGDIILKMVNYSNAVKPMKVNLGAFRRFNADAEQIVLSGQPDAENTLENPENVVHVTSTFKASKNFNYQAPPMSLTVIRIKTKS